MRDRPAIRSLLCTIRGAVVVAGLIGICIVAGYGVRIAGALLLGGAAVLVLPLIGSPALRRRLSTLSAVEHRLQHLAVSPTDPPQPIATSDAAAQAWNALVAERNQLRALQELEASVARQLCEARSSAGNDVLNSIGEGIAVTDLDGRLTMLNESLAALLGDGNAPDVENRRIDDLLESLAADDAPAEFRDAAGTTRPVSFDVTRTNGGEQHVLRLSRRPHRNAQKEIVGHVWSVRDVTQLQLAEQMRENFVATASHELRSPLGNIRAYAETLAIADGIDVEKQKEFCNTILTEATRLARFVDDLLDVTRLQAGSLVLDKHETDIDRLLHEVCGKVSAQVAQKRIGWREEFPAKLPKMSVDKSKLAAALVNLLSNAVKYTPHEGTIAFRVEADSRQIAFIVEDTGFGIAPHELARVFDKFFRSDDARVRGIVGSGLGLAFSKEVARLHAGDLKVHSELNKGSRFTLTIPLQTEAD